MATTVIETDAEVESGGMLPALSALEDAFLQQRLRTVAARQICFIKACEIVGEDISNVGTSALSMRALRMERSDAIQAHLRAVSEEQARNAICTREQHMAELARLAKLAESKGSLAVAVQAEKLRGQVAGLYRGTDAPEGQGEEASALAALVSQIGALLGPEAADTARRRLGIKAPAADSTLEPSVPRGTSVQ